MNIFVIGFALIVVGIIFGKNLGMSIAKYKARKMKERNRILYFIMKSI